MNILYLTKGDHVDYQNDCLLIGLKELFGKQVVDVSKQVHIYDTADPLYTKGLYGKGMTVTRVLPDPDVDRTNLTQKIKDHFFDFIIYGSIWRCSNYFQEIRQYYKPGEVIVVDGEDETNIHSAFSTGCIYFKRELIYDHDNLYPISFAMPTSKLNFCTDKTRDQALITPLDTCTYIYTNEQDYYKDYQQSRFGITLKKAGWDCLRHYEMLGNGCLPVFLNIENCPPQTLVNFPKSLCQEVLQKAKSQYSATQLYDEYVERFKQAMEQLTTVALANYVLETII